MHIDTETAKVNGVSVDPGEKCEIIYETKSPRSTLNERKFFAFRK